MKKKFEQRNLAKFACDSNFTRGRLYPDDDLQFNRTEYQRDRDRILHSEAFRRLKQKTQVFVNNMSDHVRTRLTHTLEVAQLARSISRYLFLNDDLCEAIALAHDLGHPPYGHAGENTFEPIRSLTVAELLTECSGNKWKNVTLENLSDMATGNYFKTEYPFDERSPEHLRFIYDSPTSKEKLSIACRSFPKKTKPGRKFIYHTSDTYILGEAMNKYLQTNTENKDYFGELLAPFLRKLGLSYASESTLRTEDKKQQAYTGWGMFLLRDDVPKLSGFLQRIKKEETDSYSFIKEAMRPNKENSLSAIPGFNIFYNNGFWSRRYKKGTFGCKEETWIPFMSGFGGITIVFLPNDMTYYYFSDGYTYSWDDAVFAANKIRSFCEE